MKDELKSVTTIGGALSVMTRGLLMMPLWPVGNLDSAALVSFSFGIKIRNGPHACLS